MGTPAIIIVFITEKHNVPYKLLSVSPRGERHIGLYKYGNTPILCTLKYSHAIVNSNVHREID